MIRIVAGRLGTAWDVKEVSGTARARLIRDDAWRV
jgi:hypothetical protein